MENEFKSVKVDCSFCGKEIECPENMLEKSETHMCFECFQGIDDKKMPKDTSKVHIDIPQDKFNDVLPEAMTNSLVEEAFPEIWKERKRKLREMSKKELAEEMFGAGAYIAISDMMRALKHETERESKTKGKVVKKNRGCF